MTIKSPDCCGCPSFPYALCPPCQRANGYDAFKNKIIQTSAIDAAHLERQREWSEKTFGPGARTKGVINHIRKELHEIEQNPSDLSEWIDVVILAFDGAWRAGYEPQEIIDALKEKQTKNEARQWPDWSTMSEDIAIEHIRKEV